MQNLTQDGQQFVNNLSVKYNLSYDAVMHMLIAVNNGFGTQAQFNCPELGGSGQWMRGGMIMVGDMFNHNLKMTVDNLCNELSSGLANLQVFVKIPHGMPGSHQWWPSELGQPFSTGAQNNIRYAVFPNRLAVELNGQVTVYDTLDHSIGGVSQQQGGDSSLTFSSQYGTISVNSLPIISGQGTPQAPQQNFAEPIQHQSHQSSQSFQNQSYQNTTPNTSSVDETIQLIEKIAKLKEIGAISDEEYHAKKTELLNRI